MVSPKIFGGQAKNPIWPPDYIWCFHEPILMYMSDVWGLRSRDIIDIVFRQYPRYMLHVKAMWNISAKYLLPVAPFTIMV